MGMLMPTPKAPAPPPPPPNAPTMADSAVGANLAASQRRIKAAAGAGYSNTVQNAGGQAGMSGAPITSKPLLGS